MKYKNIKIIMGLWGAREGKAWLDDVMITEIGLVNILRRPGCPLVVKSSDSKIIYVEGRDFEPVIDPKLGRAKWDGFYDRYHEEPIIRMRNNLPNGSRLLVSFYHPMLIERSHVDACMTEEKVYEIFKRQVERFYQLCGPRRYCFLGYNELRTGGSCALCKSTGKTPGELLADNVQRISMIVRKFCPNVQLIVWDDMFDPNHNAHDNYYLVDGTLEKSWKGLSTDTIICNWKYEKRHRGLSFFSELDHNLIPSADFDPVTDPISYMNSWLKVMDTIPEVIGMIYTTWQGNYEHMASFGRILGSHKRPPPAEQN